MLGYIYSPFEEIAKYAALVRFVVVPVMLLGILNVERPCSSTTHLDEIGLTRGSSEALPAYGEE